MCECQRGWAGKACEEDTSKPPVVDVKEAEGLAECPPEDQDFFTISGTGFYEEAELNCEVSKAEVRLFRTVDFLVFSWSYRSHVQAPSEQLVFLVASLPSITKDEQVKNLRIAGLVLKTYQANFWLPVLVFHLHTAGNSTGNPKIGLMCFDQQQMMWHNCFCQPS